MQRHVDLIKISAARKTAFIRSTCNNAVNITEVAIYFKLNNLILFLFCISDNKKARQPFSLLKLVSSFEGVLLGRLFVYLLSNIGSTEAQW